MDIRVRSTSGGLGVRLRPLALYYLLSWSMILAMRRHLNRGVNKVEAAKERERLFKIIEDLVIWENTNNEQVLAAARSEICKSWRETCDLNRNHPDAASLCSILKSFLLSMIHLPAVGHSPGSTAAWS